MQLTGLEFLKDPGVMRFRSCCCSVTSAFLLMGLAGCGGSESKIKTVEIAGTVRFDGEPVKSGMVNFLPTDGKNPSTGGTILDGEYTAQVPSGPMQITISSPVVVGKRKAYDTPDSPMIDVVEELIPAAYNVETTLEHTVTESKLDLNFDLKSRQ